MNRLLKYMMVLMAFLSASINVNAAKSDGAVHFAKQPDGTMITFQLLGDEHLAWYQTTDGVLLVKDDKTFYVGTVTASGTLESSGIMAHDSEDRSAEELAAILRQDRNKFFAQAETKARAARSRMGLSDDEVTYIDGYPSSSRFCPHSGTVRVPIIMMQYTDKSFTVASSTDDVKAVFDDYFNGETTTPYTNDTRFHGYGSVAQYFKDASGGNLNFVFDLYGPYTTDNIHDYYGNGGYDGVNHGFNLATEAVKKADGDIDFSQYDSNGDGKVDMVYILYAGTGANISGDKTDFWPKCWYNTSISTADGKTINVIGGANELTTEDFDGEPLRAGVGVTCHEMSHGLGMPDVYWTSSTVPTDAQGYVDYNNCGPEMWDLMDGGENTYNGIWPCQYVAWERDAMGWLTPEELTKPCTVTVYPLSDTEKGKVYRVTNPENSMEYYMIEDWVKSEWNYKTCSMYGSGLMISHINMSSSGLSMTCNNTYGKPNVTLVPADEFILASFSAGKTIQYKGEVVTMPTNQNGFSTNYQNDLLGDVYPYPVTQSNTNGWTSNVTSVSAYKNYTGDDMVSKYPITDIVKNSDGSITFNFMGGSPSVTLNNERYATFSCATDVVVKTDGIKAYKAAVKGENINLTVLEGYIPAGTGVLLYGEGLSVGTKVCFELPCKSDGIADVSNNDLQPTTTATDDIVKEPTLSGNDYIWALSSDNQFRRYTGGSFIANRAYLIHEWSSNDAKAMHFVFTDETDGVETVHSSESIVNNPAAYNILGQRVSNDAKGLVFKDGKKYFVK